MSEQINLTGLSSEFAINETSIKSRKTGSEFLFKGLHLNSNEIKSTEGIGISWVEEAEAVEKDSWDYLLPTIRDDNSELVVTFNPDQENAATAKLWIDNPLPGTIIRKVSYRDNPYFSQRLEEQRQHCLRTDPDAYDWIWEGNFRKISEATIFRHRVAVREFEAPEDARFLFGADWGFASDPTVLLRLFIKDAKLYIDYEAYGYGTEIDRIGALFDTIPGARKWPIKADSARPETISYIRRQGFNITAAAKWKGSVEDGIAHLQGFDEIVIHPRCVKMAEESRLYRWKVERITNTILPVPVDAWNHGWDSARYALDGYIKHDVSILDVL